MRMMKSLGKKERFAFRKSGFQPDSAGRLLACPVGSRPAGSPSAESAWKANFLGGAS